MKFLNSAELYCGPLSVISRVGIHGLQRCFSNVNNCDVQDFGSEGGGYRNVVPSCI